MNVYEIITDRLIAQLEAGVIPWRKPWSSANAGALRLPVNRTTGKAYRGINSALLMFSPYQSHEWVTYKQAQALGANVRKGERGWPIVFWKFDTKADAQTGEDKEFAFARSYTVFNVEQCDGFASVSEPLPFDPVKVFDPIASAEALVSGYMTSANHPDLRHGGPKAFYMPVADYVQMPPAITFETQAAYYSTLFHEFAHSTGADNRLGRVFGKRKGDVNYAKEELVAEFSAAFLCAEAGISDSRELDNSAAYLSSWLSKLRNDKTLAVSAAQRAQKAADYILGRAAAQAAPVRDEVAA